MALLSSCRPVPIPEPELLPRYGGTLVWGVYHKPSAINPFFTTQTASAALVQLIFNGLVRINAVGAVEPDLAKSWSLSADGLTYTFHLRRGVRFHDGTELTAQDALFTYNILKDPAVNSPFRESFDIVESFSAPDPYTFQVLLKKPSAAFIYRMVRYIAPEHLLKGRDPAGSDLDLHPVGTGPFRFQQWTQDGRIILEANPDYYEGRPYLDEVAVRTYIDSQDVWAGLMRGEVDCAEFIDRKDYEVIRRDPAFKAFAVVADSYYALRYVLTDPVLSDRRVRRAIGHAVDVKGLMERVEGGYGVEACGPFCPGSVGFDPDAPALGYDPAKAGYLLEEAGWQDDDADGIREKDGQELALHVLFDSRSEAYERIVMALRQQLQEAGIRLEALTFDDDGMVTREFLKEKKIQACLTFILGGADPDQQSLDWSSRENEAVLMLWGYDNEEVNRLFDRARLTQDQEEKRAAYQEIHRLIYDSQPACFLYFPSVFHGISSRFKNTERYFNVNMPNYVIKDFYVSEGGDVPGDRRGR